MAKSLESQLLYACLSGDLDLVKDLVSQGADIHAMDDCALRLAASYGHLAVVKFLISNGADIHTCEDYALRWAEKNNHVEIVKYLEEVILSEKRLYLENKLIN